MKANLIPLFYDDSSRKSILTFDDPKTHIKGTPKSIVSILKDAKMDKCVFVSDNFESFVKAIEVTKKNKIQLIFISL